MRLGGGGHDLDLIAVLHVGAEVLLPLSGVGVADLDGDVQTLGIASVSILGVRNPLGIKPHTALILA